MATSTSNKISDIINSAPVSFDPEDDDADDTTACKNYNEETIDSDEELNSSIFRKRNVELLEELDGRYNSAQAVRKSLRDNDDSESDEIEDIDEAEDKTEDFDESSEEESYVEEDEVLLEHDSVSNDDDDNTKVFNSTSSSELLSQSNKSSCVRQQLSIWESLLEMRIQMQKCLHASNKFSQAFDYQDLQSNSNESNDKLNETKDHVQNLLDKFMQLQFLLLRRYPETKNILNNDQSMVKGQDDEEIPSDTDDEASVEEPDVDIPQKRMKLSQYKDELSKQFELYRNYRNSVLQKWHDKTRIAANKSENVHSITQQINHVLSNKDKLIKATQLIRTDSGVLDKNNESSDVYDSNIFDDTDFYHHLLRELIEFRSADLTDPIKLSRQWVQLQNLRSKMKKKVDTKATKGRKIRYVVHQKLVNFMAPVNDATWEESAKTELYHSIFGKTIPNKIVPTLG